MLTIKTDRLVLRDFQASDLSDYGRLWAGVRFQRFCSERESAPDKVDELVKMFIAQALEQPRTQYQLAITTQAGCLIGSCGVRITSLEDQQGSVGIELGEAYWGNDHALEAAHAMLEFGFSNLGLHRIFAETISKNHAAIALARKLGMREEGELRENRWFKAQWWNTTLCSILKPEWEEAPSSNRLEGTPRRTRRH